MLQQPQQVQDFVAAAHALGVQVWPVLGDPRHVLLHERAALAGQIRAYLDYNAAVPAAARLDGVQLDIEPHLLPGFALAQAQWRRAWLETVHAVQEQVRQTLPLDLVVPVWWGTHPAWGRALLDALQGPDLSLTVMNYRTTVPALRAGAEPFLEWGEAQRVLVSMALEAGSIGPDESRWQFVQAEQGELLWLEVAGHRVLALFDVPQTIQGEAVAARYRLQREGRAAAGNITFGGDLLRLESAAAELEPEWRSWSVYAGLAIQGLDEVLLHTATAVPAEPLE